MQLLSLGCEVPPSTESAAARFGAPTRRGQELPLVPNEGRVGGCRPLGLEGGLEEGACAHTATR